MQKLLLTALLFLMCAASAQDNKIPAFLKRLALEPRPVSVFSLSKSNIIDLPDLPRNFKTTGQEITKTKQGVFLNPLGTGRLYQLIQADTSFYWKRIDSTIYTGYNFGSLFFSIDTTFYSYGGQGFFNLNGNLRYFNEHSREWDALSLNKTIPWIAKTSLFHSIDTSNKMLYLQALPTHQDQTLKQKTIIELERTIWRLDITKGEWIKLGKITPDNLFTIGETTFGTLVNFYTIVDVKKNKIYSFNKSLTNRLLKALGSSSDPKELAYTFAIDSTLYLGDSNNFIDSLIINRVDLIESETPFYTPVEAELPIDEREALIGLTIMLSMSTAFLLYRNKYKKSAVPVAMVSNMHGNATQENDKKELQVTFRSGKLMELLNEREKLLLEFIYNHSMDERLTTIEEINKVIGAAQRTPEVQKRLRSDLIGSINDKIELISESKFNIIEKQRSEFDKRSFEYFIHPEQMELAEKVLGKKLND